MKNIDVELYISQLVSFFENNPNDLMELIGNLQKDEFYKKLKEQSLKNLNEGEDHVLTRNQIINIVVELKIPELFSKDNPKQVVEGFIEKTKWGDIILN